MKRFTLAATAVLTLAAAFPAAAQFQKPEDAIKYRKAAFTVMANHFARIGAMANGKAAFDARAAQINAEIVNNMAALPWAGFIDGTASGDTRSSLRVTIRRFTRVSMSPSRAMSSRPVPASA